MPAAHPGTHLLQMRQRSMTRELCQVIHCTERAWPSSMTCQFHTVVCCLVADPLPSVSVACQPERIPLPSRSTLSYTSCEHLNYDELCGIILNYAVAPSFAGPNGPREGYRIGLAKFLRTCSSVEAPMTDEICASKSISVWRHCCVLRQAHIAAAKEIASALRCSRCQTFKRKRRQTFYIK